MISEETPFPNLLLEKYTVLQKISHGGYAEVFHAKTITNNASVAIKVMKNVFCDCIDAKRILREICILKQLDHPNIVKLLDFYIGPTDYAYATFTNVYLVLEYYPIDMKQFLFNYKFENQTPATNDLVKHITRQLVDAMTYLQSRHVMHRDLKPANIIVNEQMNIKICDFGLARVLTLAPNLEDNPILLQLKQFDIQQKDVNFLDLKYFVQQEKRQQQQTYQKRVRSQLLREEGKLIPNQLTMDKILSQPVFAYNFTEYRGNEVNQPNKGSDDEDENQLQDNAIVHYHQISQQKREQQELLIELYYQTDIITQHIGTRWYRAPEIILLNQTHDYKVDSWALGCIFAELLGTLSLDSLKGALFPGNSCYPLSPKKIKQEVFQYNYDSLVQTSKQIAVFDQREQLFIIISVIGSKNSSEADITFIQNPTAREFVQQFVDINGMKLDKLYPLATKEELDFLKQLIQFNPYERAQINSLQEHPYLKTGYDKKRQTMTSKLKLHVQDSQKCTLLQSQKKLQIDPVVLDFEIRFTDQSEGFFLDEIDLRLLFLRELNNYQPIQNYQIDFGQYCDMLIQKIIENKQRRTSQFEI